MPMYLKTIFVGIVLSCTAMLFGQSVGVSYNTKAHTFNPSVIPLTAQLYPVFCFSMPEGYTDFELKASVTNFKAPGDTDTEDEPSDHVGEEVVWYYNSTAPYISDTEGRCKFQKFDREFTFVYFQVSDAKYYNFSPLTDKQAFSGSWDARRYIVQAISNNTIDESDNTWSLCSYLKIQPSNTSSYTLYPITTNANTVPYINNSSSATGSPYSYNRLFARIPKVSGSRVGGIMVVIGWSDENKGNYKDLTPTNVRLMWTIRFFNSGGGEQDSSGKPVHRPIFPITWTNSINNRITSSE